jgi:hypothetical protein
MKNLILLLSFVFTSALIAKEESKNHHSEEDKVVVTEVVDGDNVYGNKWQADFDQENIEKAISKHDELVDKEMIFTGNISKVCQKAGCWMILETNGQFARVDFNNHSFFIPKDTQGTAEVFGVLQAKTMSEEKKKHLEEDGAGKLEDQVFEITATSVKIKS